MAKTLQWFLNRIGKTVYRDKSTCTCESCLNALTEGLIIRNEQHAKYLYMIENGFEAEGRILNYRDEK